MSLQIVALHDSVNFTIRKSILMNELEQWYRNWASSAAGGGIAISFHGGEPVTIATKGKTTEQIEQEIASKLSGAQLSNSVLYPHTSDGDARNSKPFDGSEVQLIDLPVNSITIDLNDPNLSVLTKFKFKDENAPISLTKPIIYILLVTAIGLFIRFFTSWFKMEPAHSHLIRSSPSSGL